MIDAAILSPHWDISLIEILNFSVSTWPLIIFSQSLSHPSASRAAQTSGFCPSPSARFLVHFLCQVPPYRYLPGFHSGSFIHWSLYVSRAHTHTHTQTTHTQHLYSISTTDLDNCSNIYTLYLGMLPWAGHTFCWPRECSRAIWNLRCQNSTIFSPSHLVHLSF